ncbi:hypothetical protein F2P56_033815 [Juglans regia]|uniref:PGG domain-containing protein n=1 Tax=Juglans regia TaxID=51240 RepID=A0A833U613_JUGRE|nr:hypothetical protein F2P56_033815 [Juglans regia]
MQRELLWFQEIEKIVPKSSVNGPIGPEEKPPRDIFVKTHEELQKNGEQWMRNTANSCMLVAALIATVVFPAAFTVPGGNNQETGIPIFLETSWFTNRLFIPSQQRLHAMETKNDNQTGHNDRNQVRFTSTTTSHPIPLGGIRPNYEQGSSV